jgi:hypothetical protein
MNKEYEKFGLTEDKYNECRYNLSRESFHVYKNFEEEQEECSVLYFDSDDGVALISAFCEIFEADGFKIELIDCKYCDIKMTDMIEIIYMFEEFEEKTRLNDGENYVTRDNTTNNRDTKQDHDYH